MDGRGPVREHLDPLDRAARDDVRIRLTISRAAAGYPHAVDQNQRRVARAPPQAVDLRRVIGKFVLARIRARRGDCRYGVERSEEHTSELQSLMRISYAVFC